MEPAEAVLVADERVLLVGVVHSRITAPDEAPRRGLIAVRKGADQLVVVRMVRMVSPHGVSSTCVWVGLRVHVEETPWPLTILTILTTAPPPSAGLTGCPVVDGTPPISRRNDDSSFADLDLRLAELIDSVAVAEPPTELA